MVQNCCALCMGRIGEFVCFLLCCKCLCCCCKKKQKQKEPDIEMVHTNRPPMEFGSIADDESVYNGSSTYSESVVKRQPYSESATSGIYMSESSAYSGSIIENKPEFKLEFNCEIKGIVEVGGTQQPVKGVLHIVPDEPKKRPLPETPSIYAVNPGVTKNANLRHKNSSKDTLNKEEMFIKTPKPLPRKPDIQNERDEEMYFSTEENSQAAEAEIDYDEPKPPLPVKSYSSKDPTKSYIPVYENFDCKTNKPTSSADEDSIQNTNLKVPVWESYSNENSDEHIYEYINHGPNAKKQSYVQESEDRIDYEIYMS